MTLTPLNRRHTLANAFVFKPRKTDFEVYRDPVSPKKHKRSLSENKPTTYLPKPTLTTLLTEHQNTLEQLQQKIKQLELEIAYYRSKKQYEKEIKTTLRSMNLNYKRLNDIDLDLTLLIEKLKTKSPSSK